mmetsp:Transcript_15486/g.23787  ORF Transcript_15486/g.23787 Transcript_15486/m.23787 type:complete len:119 (-) Transcript_15486:1340-1696(-)
MDHRKVSLSDAQINLPRKKFMTEKREGEETKIQSRTRILKKQALKAKSDISEPSKIENADSYGRRNSRWKRVGASKQGRPKDFKVLHEESNESSPRYLLDSKQHHFTHFEDTTPEIED